MGDPFRQARALEWLVNEERSSALGLTGERLERELAELRRIDGLLASAAERERVRLSRLRADSWEYAGRMLWQLIVQREALGLTRHDDVYETYGVPRGLTPMAR